MAEREATFHPMITPERLAAAEEDYRHMAAWLPARVSAILDIGSGHALIDVWLARHYGGGIDVHLLDGDREIAPVGKERTGFRQTSIAWRDRNVGVAYLQREVPTCRVHGHPPDPTLTIPCDLIISRRSWGHHYPIATYLDLADRSLCPDGRMIVDIRNDTDGLRMLAKRGFRVISENLELRSVKCKRFALSR